MIGRNDPCPCGSGKKYKKCCTGKSEVPMEKLVDEELNRILMGVYEQSPGPAGLAEFNAYNRQWGGKLGNHWDGNSIERAVSEYFLFVARRDLWMRYLLRVLNTPVRSAARSVVETWKTPIVLFGKVKEVQNGFIEIKEALGSKTYFLENEEGMPVGKDSIVFGVVLSDNRKHPNGVHVITSLMFIKDGNEAFQKEVIALAESSRFEKNIDFYKEHMVDIYRIMLAKENSSVEELIEQDLTENQKEAVVKLDDTLEQLGADSKVRDLLKNISITYFLKKQPNFRKPNVISAAVFLVAVDLGMLAYTMTNVQIAKLFEVSTNSMAKHAESINEFVLELQNK